MTLISILGAALIAQALNEVPEGAELKRVTCYTATGNRMANGEYPYEGCVAGKKEDIGKIVAIYSIDCELIGEFEIKDTGGKLIRSGERIDVYRNTLSGCYDWIHEYGDYLYVVIKEPAINE